VVFGIEINQLLTKSNLVLSLMMALVLKAETLDFVHTTHDPPCIDFLKKWRQLLCSGLVTSRFSVFLKKTLKFFNRW